MSKKSFQSILRAKYPESEYVLISEVSDGAGAGRNRSLDYMAINLWPSRGLSISGIELKSHRSDWLREIKNPLKQELHFQYCDFFYLLTDKEGVAKIEEIPETWGWLMVKNDKIYQMKAAPKLESKPVTRGFLTAMLRRAASKDNYVHIDTIEERIEQAAINKMQAQERHVKYQLQEYERLKVRIKEFEEQSGIEIGDRFKFKYGTLKEIGTAVKFVMENDLEKYKKDIERLKKTVDGLQQKLGKAIEEIANIDFKPFQKQQENENDRFD